MQYLPHDYQRFAIDFLETHPVAALLLDMGLGKTSIVLHAVQSLMYDRFLVRKVLVVAPLRVARYTWPEELAKWDDLSLTCSLVTGTAPERLRALQADADLYIINRENLTWLLQQDKRYLDFDMAVLDELSSFKSNSKRTTSFLKLRPRLKRVVGLTGTPSSNGLMDLFWEYRCLDMGKRLGRFIGQYRLQYFRPGKRSGDRIFTYDPLPGAEDAIYEAIGDITISMRAKDHLPMPELITSQYRVQMDKAEEEQYQALKKELVLSCAEGEVTAANAAALAGKLTQMANGAVYTDDKVIQRIHDKKLEALEDIIESANGRPVLLAYWYQHDRERIVHLLSKIKVSYSQISDPESIRRWNRGELMVGLIHPASAGHGLNLQQGGANLVVWFSLTWSLELYQQTNARLWRQGQTSRTVVIQHIVTAGTMDESILQALAAKDGTQSALIRAVKAQM